MTAARSTSLSDLIYVLKQSYVGPIKWSSARLQLGITMLDDWKMIRYLFARQHVCVLEQDIRVSRVVRRQDNMKSFMNMRSGASGSNDGTYHVLGQTVRAIQRGRSRVSSFHRVRPTIPRAFGYSSARLPIISEAQTTSSARLPFL